MIDLHVHSNCSDGTMSPSELVSYALQKGLQAFALTDHDTVAGLPEAISAAHGSSLEVLSGIEFSTEYHGIDIHIVGIDFDYENSVFLNQLQHFRNSRNIRNEKMIQRMHNDGIDISHAQMLDAFGASVWTRAHFARYLMEHGYVSQMSDAFVHFIGENAPYYVPREKVTPAQAVELIYQSGGIPILAHPMHYSLSEPDLHVLLKILTDAGLIGMEGIYSTHTRREENFVRRLAIQHHLLISGGSDFHGVNKPDIDLGVGRGNLQVPYFILKNLRDRRNQL